MIAYWIEYVWTLLPVLLFMSISVAPVAVGTLVAAIHRSKNNQAPYFRNLWGATAAGLVTVVFLFGSLFGTDLNKSAMAGLIFVIVPFYAVVAFGAGYVLGGFHPRQKLTEAAERAGAKADISDGDRHFIWLPVALLGFLMVGFLIQAIPRNVVAVAERASDQDALRRVYEEISRGGANSAGQAVFLAQNPNTPSDVLTKLSKHEHPTVRRFVAIHPNTPQQIKDELNKPAAVEPPKPRVIPPCEKRTVRALPPRPTTAKQLSLTEIVPTLYFPQNGASFSCAPLLLTLEWDPVPGATEYLVEFQFLDSNGFKWWDIRYGSMRTPENYRDIEFSGSRRGRWRVTAFNADSRSQPSAWAEFAWAP